jgi:hypothetical protein
MRAYTAMALTRKGKETLTRLLSDRRGAVAFELPIVYLCLVVSLLLPLTELAIAGLKFNSAYQALRDMGQFTQYSQLDATDSTSISAWQSSLPTTIDGYTITATIKCGNAGSAPPCAGTDFPKYYLFQTSFSLSPMVLGRVFGITLCSTCTVSYSQRFQ